MYLLLVGSLQETPGCNMRFGLKSLKINSLIDFFDSNTQDGGGRPNKNAEEKMNPPFEKKSIK